MLQICVRPGPVLLGEIHINIGGTNRDSQLFCKCYKRRHGLWMPAHAFDEDDRIAGLSQKPGRFPQSGEVSLR